MGRDRFPNETGSNSEDFEVLAYLPTVLLWSLTRGCCVRILLRSIAFLLLAIWQK